MPSAPEQLSGTIETLYRSESGRVLATLVRLLGDLDLAEEAMHEAFAAALESWPKTGIPDKPQPWLISTAHASRPSMGCDGGLSRTLPVPICVADWAEFPKPAPHTKKPSP
jgi:hypothetical protein